MRGKPALWCDYVGPVDDVFAGLMIMPDADNFRKCRWHVRDYGFMTANPFGHWALNLGSPGKITVRKGESLNLGFGILVHSSDSQSSIDLDAAYRDYLRLIETID